MADESFARPQPIQHPALGALATLLRNVDEFGRKPFGYDNPPVAMLSDMVGLPSVHRTLERASRGAPLTSGTGWTTLPLQDTTQALFAAPGIAQGIGALGKVAGRGTLAGMNAVMADAAPAGSIPLRSLQQTGAVKPVIKSLADKTDAPIIPVHVDHREEPRASDYDPDLINEMAAKLHEELNGQ